MPKDDAPIGATCCAPTTPGFRMLTFPDGTQSGVFGLNDIFAAVRSEGMPVCDETAREIVERLAVRNYIASPVRQQYCDLILREYERFVEGRTSESRQREGRQAPPGPAERKGRSGVLSRIFGRKK